LETKIQYINENQVSEITKMALSTLRNNRSKGLGIPYIKLGRSVRYDLQDVIEFMEAHKIRTEK
jgi:predicted DNA-binding transcriptional regulator AlpA